jgi:hypothetical protein
VEAWGPGSQLQESSLVEKLPGVLIRWETGRWILS